MSGPTFVSYAQHGEDVVIWRALGHVPDGFYVDVGAADPSEDSVTRALYERGWRGIHVEAFHDYAQRLREARPEDVVVQAAAGSEAGELTFYQVPGTGLSTVVAREALVAAGRGYEVTSVTVPLRTVDEMLSEHVPPGREIHVMKIDVEGAEEAVLRGAALERWRPWVVVIEATRPGSTERTSDAWEHLVTSAGYVVTMFDGLNLWFRRADLTDLEHALSYPACPLDPYRRPAPPATANKAALDKARRAQAEAEKQRAAAEKKAADAKAQLDRTRRRLKALETSPWWRMTRPGRSVVHRAKKLTRRRRAGEPVQRAAVVPAPATEQPAPVREQPAPVKEQPQPAAAPAPASGTPHDVVLARLQVLLEATGRRTTGSADLLGALPDLLAGPDRDRWLWALHVVHTGALPDDTALEAGLGLLEVEGPEAVLGHLGAAAAEVPANAWTRTAALEVVTVPVIDVTHTATNDLHSGIQRVVRETVPRWLALGPAELLVMDPARRAWRRPTDLERARVVAWPPSQALREQAAPAPEKVVLPWGTRVLAPEMVGHPLRADLLRGVATHSGNAVAGIAFDMTPVTCAEATSDTMPSGFARHLSALKHADRVSAISDTVAREFELFFDMLPGQGLTPPEVRANSLPSAPAHPAGEAGRSQPPPRTVPLVVYVSTIHPRKNQMRVLQAAERLWREGLGFELVFIGSGAGLKRDAFDEAVAHLRGLGRLVHVVADAPDDVLWQAYREARCTVYASLVEGYGLPAVESLSVGTPVVLSQHGSMGEIGRGGGAVLVDPRSVPDIARGLRSLLTDDDLHAELRAAALARPRTTWDDYARATWDWLVDGKDTSATSG